MVEIIEVRNLRVSSEVNRKRHKRYKDVRKPFILACGEEYIKGGKLIKGYDIHHQIPLSIKEGTNSFDNLCIIPKSFHQYLNIMVYDPQINSNRKTCKFPKFARIVDDKQKEEMFELLEKRRIR